MWRRVGSFLNQNGRLRLRPIYDEVSLWSRPHANFLAVYLTYCAFRCNSANYSDGSLAIHSAARHAAGTATPVHGHRRVHTGANRL